MKKIYIVLSYTGSVPSKLIRFFTKKNYAHVSISTNYKLDAMYSFGRKVINNPLNAGLIKENIKDGLFKVKPYSIIRVMELEVNDEEYINVKDTLNKFWAKQSDMKYNYKGAILTYFNLKKETKEKYFCSQFVATVLKESNINILDKDADIARPHDFYTNDNLTLVYEGLASNYIVAK